MRFKSSACLALAFMVLSPVSLLAQFKHDADLYLTTEDRSSLFAEQHSELKFAKGKDNATTIEVDDKKKFQSIDGFGFALTGGSAQLLMQMRADSRSSILRELFSTADTGIGVSYLRVSIGASDMNDHVYTYDDMPAGQKDADLSKFTLKEDQAAVIPVLKQVLAIDPKIKILGSPWTAPSWMKTNEKPKGGSLKKEYYANYAQYFVKYIQGMAAEGIHIDAVTVQNEPRNPKNTPSLVMTAEEQADFIKNFLGPAFEKAKIRTKIILYDHNCDMPEYPLTVLKDADARKYVDGTGFHLYEGEITAMSKVHDAYPDKNLYFTEQMVVDGKDSSVFPVARAVSRIVIGATRNWSRNVLLWNLAADPDFGPHTSDGGCPMCQGAITIDHNDIARNSAYYTVAHASRFVRPGSVRVGSNDLDNLHNVAFKTPEGKHVLIVANTGSGPQSFQIRYHGKDMSTSLAEGAVGTYVW